MMNLALQLLGIFGIGIGMLALIGLMYWFLTRGWKQQKRYNRARTLAARENVRRVREEQQRLREQQQYAQGGPPPGPETRRR